MLRQLVDFRTKLESHTLRSVKQIVQIKPKVTFAIAFRSDRLIHSGKDKLFIRESD